MKIKNRLSSRVRWLAAGLLAGVFLLNACESVDENQLVASAKQYIREHKLSEARLELKNVLQHNPQNAEARFLLGNLNITIGDMATAVKEFARARDAGWNEADTQRGRARALIGSYQFEKMAEVEIRDSYPVPVQADLYGLKAFALAAGGKMDEAAAMLAKGMKVDDSVPQLLRTAIQLAISNNDLAGAEKYLKRALSLYPDNTDLLLLGGYLAMRKNDNRQAKVLFEKILTSEPKNLVTFNGRGARLVLARLSLMEKDPAAAEKVLKRLLKRVPEDLAANYIAGMLNFEQGDYEQAEKHLLKVLKYVPEHDKTLLLYGTVNFAQKDYESATYYLNKYLQKKPTDMPARKLLGRAYMLQGRDEEAGEILLSGLEIAENDVELMALIGFSQLRGGNLMAGIGGLEKAVQAAPESRSLRSELAKAYISAGQTEEALKQLDKIQRTDGEKGQTQILKIAVYLRAGQYDQAISVVHEMLKKRPDDAIMQALAGNVFAATGDNNEARRYFNRALALQPDYALAKMLLAALDEKEGDIEAAERLYHEVAETQNVSVDPLLALARIVKKRGDDRAMVEWLEKARAMDEKDLRSRLVLAEIYLRVVRLNEVEVLVKELVGIAPNESAVLSVQGQLLMSQQRYNDALVPLGLLVEKSTNSVPARVMLAESWIHLGQLKEARSQLERVLEISEFDVPSLFLLANLEFAEGRFEQAMKYAKQVQKIVPDFASAYVFEGRIAEHQKQSGVAARAYKKALELDPSGAVTLQLASSYLKLGDLAAAKQTLLKWLQAHPDDVQSRLLLGGVYQANGENRAAVAEYEQVLVQQPENVVMLNNLAWLYSLENREDSLSFAEKAYGLSPGNPGIQDTYGWLLIKQGQIDHGKHILQKALDALPGNIDVQYHYAVALARSGKKDEARKRLQKIIDSGRSFSDRGQAIALLQSLS